MCLLRGKQVAALMPNPDANATEFWWNVYLATDDCDGTVARIRGRRRHGAAGADGRDGPGPDGYRAGPDRRPVRAVAGPRARRLRGGERAELAAAQRPGDPDPGPAREFYAEVFDFTLDGNQDLPGVDFTFLRRPDGHEIGGIMGDPAARVVGVGHDVRGRRHRRGRGGAREPPAGAVGDADGLPSTGGSPRSPTRSARSSPSVPRRRVRRTDLVCVRAIRPI